MRFQIKGGVWKNSEDEILKAAVMKYGLNNWSRVASLLVRKSAKQCKSRWYEYLDPSVKKTEWSSAEEEKLLFLAKLFPCQWKTIAPIVGRTAHQCLLHYDKLLDLAQGKQEGGTSSDLRRLRPGEIDTHPETKPSRADAIDMDDDEKEMLSEARARLANTRGKKAKRKAREKQLEEARRLASLQKRRELKAAGIIVSRSHKTRKAINYATEIPFQQNPPPGFHEITADETPKGNLNFANISLQHLEGKRRDEELERHRKDDLRKLKRLNEDNMPEALEIMMKMNEHNTLKKRAKLTLPSPLLTDSELQEIVRLGSDTTELLNVAGAGLDKSTNELLTNYNRRIDSSVYSETPIRTPKLDNNILVEAKNALARNLASTPLEGEENAELKETPYRSLLDAKVHAGRTPNTLLASIMRQTPLLKSSSVLSQGALTPLGSVASTPLRDDLSLNEDIYDYQGDPIGVKARAHMLKMEMKAALANLPAPQNEIEVTVPDVLETETLPDSEDAKLRDEDMQDEDMQDYFLKLKQEEERIRQEEWKKQTQVIQFNLPRPYFINTIKYSSNLITSTDASSRFLLQADEELNDEIKNLVEYDAAKFPMIGMSAPSVINPLVDFDQSTINKAKASLDHELALIKNAMKRNKNSNEIESLDEIWDDCLKFFIFSPIHKRYMPVSALSKNELVEAYKKQFKDGKIHLDNSTKRLKKLEKKHNLLCTGYQKRAEKFVQKIEDAQNDLSNAICELDIFTTLQSQENMAIKSRTNEMKSIVDAEKRRHQEIQEKYSDLLAIKEELESCLINAK